MIAKLQSVSIRDFDPRIVAFLEEQYKATENGLALLGNTIKSGLKKTAEYRDDLRKAKLAEIVSKAYFEFDKTLADSSGNVRGRVVTLQGVLNQAVEIANPKPDKATAAILKLTATLERQQLRSELRELTHEERSKLFFEARDRGDMDFVSAFDGLKPMMPRDILENAKVDCRFMQTQQAAPEALKSVENGLEALNSWQQTVEVAKRKAQAMLSDAGLTGTDLQSPEFRNWSIAEKSQYVEEHGAAAFQQMTNPLA